MPDTGAAALLRRAGNEPANSTRRKLLTAAAFASAALENAVLVGGAATDLHTGSYRPTDIDLVGHLKPRHAQILTELGFHQQGRHWLYTFTDEETLAIEVPGDTLGEFASEPPLVIDLAPATLAVISLNDLMMDRLLQATGGEPVTHDEAVRLAVAAYDRIDWADLQTRSLSAADDGSFVGGLLPDVLSLIRREAIRRLRRSSE